MRTLAVLLEKEFRQLFRDPFLPKLILLFPVLVMLIFPWVANLEVRNVRVTLVDQDRSALSRLIVSKVEHSGYFRFQEVTADYGRALESLEADRTDAILSIPEGFEEALVSGSPRKVSISANAVNAVKGSMGAQYLAGVAASARQEFLARRGIGGSPLPEIAVTNRYNEKLVYRNFMIPALIIILLILVCGFLPALNIVNEKERGTVEQINVTPVKPFVFILAKLIPFWLIGLTVISIAFLIGLFVYGLAPAGSVPDLYLASLLFIIVMSALGVITANFSSTLAETIFLMYFFIMVFVLMGGMLTPVESMPVWAQHITLVLPSRYFNNIMRAVYLKGATLADMGPDYLALAAFDLILSVLAAATYRKRA